MSSFKSRFWRRAVYLTSILAMMLIPLGIMAYKLFVLDYSMDSLVPLENFTVDVNMQVDGHGEEIYLRTYLPHSDDRQTILAESSTMGDFTLHYESDDLNRIGVWHADAITGRSYVKYSYTVTAKHFVYIVPDDIPIPDRYPRQFDRYLVEEPGVQVEDPGIQTKLGELFPVSRPTILEFARTVHRHLQDNFKNRNFSGFTDALTALKLGEASCNGKSRLFVALARKMNIPARLVGGIILNPGRKRTSHQWVELYINGFWVPFDTINDHFAELPANYLTLYYGDESLFRHTANTNFQYYFNTNRDLTPKTDLLAGLQSSSLNISDFYSMFSRLGISQDLLKIILMIPLGAFVVVVCRNVIGLETFGTFLPALIAAACRQTGLLWGLVGFLVIILFSSLIRKALDWMHLLHSPKMAILLTTVVLSMLGLTMLGVHFDLIDLAHVTLFPIAILAITAERYAIIEEEQGFIAVWKITVTTLIVISACYVVMSSVFFQSLILAFPELLLLSIGLNLWLGKWVGMRFSEIYRFRKLIFSGAGATG